MPPRRIPSALIERIRAQIDLVRLVEDSGVSLRQSGKNMVGKCPFHQDDTPSFSVSPQKQLYHCFGCGASGTVFTYVTERERIPFDEAVEQLATRAGISLRDLDSARPSEEQGVDEANDFAFERFREWLTSRKTGTTAQEYLSRRGLSRETIDELGLGYAPDGWDNLLKAMRRAKFEPLLLVAAGLVRQNDRGGHYDYFRDRIIFPIQDERGQVVAFGGRAMDDAEPKYLNSPDTPVYKKSDLLYFLNHARQSVQDEGRVLIVEGYMDAIALYQAGVTNVVASLGTALTQSHARRAKRYTEESVFVFDGDEAGARAVERGAPHFVREGMRTQVVVLPEGSDPDSFVREHGADAFHALVGNAAPLIQYQIERSAHGLQASTSDDKVAAIRQLADLIRIVPSPIYREQYADKIAADFGLARDVVRGELRRYRVSLSRTNTNENVSSQTPGQSADPVAAAEQRLLAYLLEHPTHVAKVADQIPPTNFTAPLHEELARVLYDSARRGETRDGRALLDACADEDLRGLIGLLLVRTLPETHVEEEIQGCVDLLLDRSLRGAELDKLAAAAEGDLEIARELSAMARERRHLTASSRTAGAFGARQRVPTLEGTIDQ